MPKTKVAPKPRAEKPRMIPRRGPDGRIFDYFVVVDGLDTVEDALERAAVFGRIGRLMQKGLNEPDPEVEAADDQDILDTVLWASEECLRRAIELHNLTVPAPKVA